MDFKHSEGGSKEVSLNSFGEKSSKFLLIIVNHTIAAPIDDGISVLKIFFKGIPIHLGWFFAGVV